MSFSWVVASKGDVCVACLSANLALKQFFQTINFHFTRTTELQPTRNFHSYAQGFAVIYPPRVITTKFASTCTVNDRLFPCFGLPSRPICQLYYQAPALHEVFHRLRVFQVNVNICIECKFPHVWKVSTRQHTSEGPVIFDWFSPFSDVTRFGT